MTKTTTTKIPKNDPSAEIPITDVSAHSTHEVVSATVVGGAGSGDETGKIRSLENEKELSDAIAIFVGWCALFGARCPQEPQSTAAVTDSTSAPASCLPRRNATEESAVISEGAQRIRLSQQVGEAAAAAAAAAPTQQTRSGNDGSFEHQCASLKKFVLHRSVLIGAALLFVASSLVVLVIFEHQNSSAVQDKLRGRNETSDEDFNCTLETPPAVPSACVCDIYAYESPGASRALSFERLNAPQQPSADPSATPRRWIFAATEIMLHDGDVELLRLAASLWELCCFLVVAVLLWKGVAWADRRAAIKKKKRSHHDKSFSTPTTTKPTRTEAQIGEFVASSSSENDEKCNEATNSQTATSTNAATNAPICSSSSDSISAKMSKGEDKKSTAPTGEAMPSLLGSEKDRSDVQTFGDNHEKSRGLNIAVSRTRGASTSMMVLVLTALIGSIAYFVVR